ncbi:hypothetical protein V6O07_15085, partial [Arthrospira platensis SPKY2]
MVVADGLGDRREQPMNTLARQRRSTQNRNLSEEGQASTGLDHDLFALLGFVDQIEFVEGNDHRAAGDVNPLGEALILSGDPFKGIDHEQGNIG